MPLITTVSNRKIYFEPKDAVTIQERLQIEKIFLEAGQHFLMTIKEALRLCDCLGLQSYLKDL